MLDFTIISTISTKGPNIDPVCFPIRKKYVKYSYDYTDV